MVNGTNEFFFDLQSSLAAIVQKIFGKIGWKNMKRNAYRESMFVFFAQLNQDDLSLEQHTEVICAKIIVFVIPTAQCRIKQLFITNPNIYDETLIFVKMYIILVFLADECCVLK